VQIILIYCSNATIEGRPHFELDVVGTQIFEAVLSVFVFVLAGVTQLQNHPIRWRVKAGVDPVYVIVSKQKGSALKFFILFQQPRGRVVRLD